MEEENYDDALVNDEVDEDNGEGGAGPSGSRGGGGGGGGGGNSMMVVREEHHHQGEEENPFDPIEKLQEIGIASVDIKRLKEAGYATCQSILMETTKKLISIKGVSEAKCEKIREAAAKITDAGTVFVTGLQALAKRERVVAVTTGSSQLDTLLGGGIETMAITEAFGEFRTGKTQLCHTLCVTTQLPYANGGGNGKVIYIDTEGTFRPARLKKIAERYNLDGDAVLENVLTSRVYTHEQQYDILLKAAAAMADDPFIRLLIIDSITALFRADFSGRGELAERQQKLNQMLSKLSKIADEFNVAVFITNQVTADPGGGAMFVTDPKKPIGGHILAHASTTRLYLRKGRGEQRICKIYDSPCLPESEAVYQIGEGGITDPTD